MLIAQRVKCVLFVTFGACERIRIQQKVLRELRDWRIEGGEVSLASVHLGSRAHRDLRAIGAVDLLLRLPPR